MAENSIAMPRKALRRALETRRGLGKSTSQPLCVIDLAEELGIEVRFVDAKTLEGMYVKDSRPIILVGSHRPRGRQAYSCAHEIGHGVFGHGTRCDALLPSSPYMASDPEERLADLFAGYLLMPRPAVVRAFSRRGWDPGTASAREYYVVAGQLGVGYSTLVGHMQWSLNLIPSRKADGLTRQTPRKIRSDIVGHECPGDLFVVDPAWECVAVDVRVGDLIHLPPHSKTEGSAIAAVQKNSHPMLARAVRAGISRISTDGWAAYVRVSRNPYIGRACWRHEEDPDDE